MLYVDEVCLVSGALFGYWLKAMKTACCSAKLVVILLKQLPPFKPKTPCSFAAPSILCTVRASMICMIIDIA